jgi:hypothetical protein
MSSAATSFPEIPGRYTPTARALTRLSYDGPWAKWRHHSVCPCGSGHVTPDGLFLHISKQHVAWGYEQITAIHRRVYAEAHRAAQAAREAEE